MVAVPAAMVKEEILSNSSWNYSVFLSFRGMDTRLGFTGHLYKALRDEGIKTFIDDEELQKGEKITPALIKAIKQSRIAIIIFSKNYASSTYCLEELVKILELREQKHRLVLPVFYQVDPSDVRHQKGIFGEAFKKLIEKIRFNDNKEAEPRWRSALKVAADLSGWHFSEGCDYEYRFISQIVDLISKKITRIPLHVTNNPVGLESRVQEVKVLLEIEFNVGVNMVGIYGIGGIGKTTIACAVYNSIADNFEGVCFLNDIRENSITKQDLAQLQKKLLADILGEKDIKLGSVKEGSTVIKERLCVKKILLILDDVDRLEHLQTLAGGLDWFGFGSRIIITTRDKHLLDAHCVERKYEVVGLNKIEALELFSWNAFKKEIVDPSYIDLSEDAISYSNGLPLALVVIGSNLCKRSRGVWESALREYRRIPNKSIYKILKVSYDSLEEFQQKIFLDVACYLRGAHLEYVIDILLHGRDLDPKYGIQELVDKSLIMIDEGNHIRIHDLIKDMGREIVRQESPSKPGKRSRLWSPEDIIHVLEGDMGSAYIQVMMVNLHLDQIVQWDGKAFEKMKNLQVLIIRSANFSTEIEYLPTSLRLFEWDGYPFSVLPSKFVPRNLVTLKLPNSCFMFDSPLKNFKSLSYLNLSNNKALTKIPDISGAPNLEELWLKGCLNLTEFHNSVCLHSKVRILEARECTKLSTFPGHIMMKSLEFLALSDCSSLKIFPEISAKMKNLIYVDLDNSGIESLPFSIQNLVGLEHLGLNGCRGLLGLPSSILTLPKLMSLRVRGCTKLHFYCKDEQEQEGAGPFLQRDITLSSCNLTDDFLPARLPFISHWKVLRIEYCNFTILPTGIMEFPFLKSLKLIHCKQLREIRDLPRSLENLVLINCMQLTEIRELPPSLKTLELIKCEQLQEIRELSSNIEKVYASNCTLLTSESLGKLLSEKFHEVRGKFFFLPGARIPGWFDHYSMGPSLSFWCRKKFPSIALCAIASAPRLNTSDRPIFILLIINGTHNITCRIELYGRPFMIDHVLVFDLETQMTVDGLILKHEWNHAEIFCFKNDSQMSFRRPSNPPPNEWEFLKGIGVYVYKQETNMEDMSFTCPFYPPPKRSTFDDFEVQHHPSIKYLPALQGNLLEHEDTWYENYARTPIIREEIWNMQAPSIIKIMLWDICQFEFLIELPTYGRLFRREITDSPLCPICEEEDETVEHVFLVCPWTRLVWFGSEFQWIVELHSLEDIEDWLYERFREIKKIHTNFNQANALVGCICWAIWNERNDFVFGGQPVNPKHALDRAKTMHKECTKPSFVQQAIFPQFWFTYKICGEAKVWIRR